MRTITSIIIHEADTPEGKNFHASDIDDWHIERGFRRTDIWRGKWNPMHKAIGYHYVIDIHGRIETGRHPDEMGAHCQGVNATSIGICLIGRGKYTPEQWDALKQLLTSLKEKYPKATIHGHYEYASAIVQGKTCPGFDVVSYAADYIPSLSHILTVA